MPSIEEISTWSESEILSSIEALLPDGWFVSAAVLPEGYWEVTVVRAVDTSGPTTEYLESHVDKRMALLNIYGLLTSRQLATTSSWSLKRELTKQPVSINSSNFPDPGDLDPEEIESVYDSLRGKK